MEQTIEEILQALVGLPLWAAGRAYNVQWFQFGGRRELPKRGGGIRTVGDYALHVQCNWRIVEHSKVAVGFGDRYYPSEHEPETDDFDWREAARNRGDDLLTAFISQHEDAPLNVVAVQIGEAALVRLLLERDVLFEIFPDESTDYEYYRLLKPGDTSKHYVVTKQGFSISQ